MDDAIKSNLIAEFGLENLPEAEREEALMKTGGIIFRGILLRVTDELDEAGQTELEKILTDKPGDEEALVAFLRAKVPDFDVMVREEIAEFKRGVLGE